MRKIKLGLLAFGTVLLTLTSCKVDTMEEGENTQLPTDRKSKIVCTTGMIGDAVKAIVGDNAEVSVLMGPGVDPHLYKTTQSDLAQLSEADVIVYNGLHLEGKMISTLESLSKTKHVFPVADGISVDKLIKMADFDDAYDPHIWFDLALWKNGVEHVMQQMIAIDSVNGVTYSDNGLAYIDELNSLQQWQTDYVNQIPKEQRILVTAHDAFHYFGESTGFEVHALQGISTTSGAGLKDVKELVDFIVDNQVPAIFIESSIPERALQSVIEGCQEKGHTVTIGGTLYSDALGAADTPEGAFVGVVEHNVRTIVDAYILDKLSSNGQE